MAWEREREKKLIVRNDEDRIKKNTENGSEWWKKMRYIKNGHQCVCMIVLRKSD